MVFNESQQQTYDNLLEQFNLDNKTYYPEKYEHINYTVYDLDDKEERRSLIENAAREHGYAELRDALTVRFKILAMLENDMILSNNKENLGSIKKMLNNISKDIEWFRPKLLESFDNRYGYGIEEDESDLSDFVDELDIEYEEKKEEEQTPQNMENEYIQAYTYLEERCKREREEAETQRINEAQAFQEKINDTVNRLEKIKNLSKMLEEMHDECEREREVLKVEAEKYNETVEKNRTLQDEIVNLLLIGGNNEDRIKELENKIQEKGGEYEKLNTRLENIKQDLLRVEQSLLECNEQKKMTENDLARAKKDISDFDKRNQETMEKMIKRHAVQLASLRDTKDKCEAQNRNLVAEQSAKETLHAQLEEQLLAKENIIAESRELAQKYINENNENENLLRFAKTQLDNANQLNKDLQRQLSELEESRQNDEVEFETRLRQVQDKFKRELEECQSNLVNIETEYIRQLEENVNSNTTVKRYLGSPNTCHKAGWVVNPETGRCWKETNPGYIRRLRWTPDKNSPKFKSKRAKSKKWELNEESGRYRLKNKRGHVRDPETGKWVKV